MKILCHEHHKSLHGDKYGLNQSDDIEIEHCIDCGSSYHPEEDHCSVCGAVIR